AWKPARERTADKWAELRGEPAPDGFRKVRVHDLKHTFCRRLRAAGVSFEARQDLLGHKSVRITTHYSQAELSNLIAAAEKVCESESRKLPATTWLRRRASTLIFGVIGAAGGSRTPDHLVRSQVLYPTELRPRALRAGAVRLKPDLQG